MRVWLNSALVQVNEAGLDEDKWPQGFGIFETIKTVDGVAYALNRHMRRAVDSGVRLGIAIPKEDIVREGIEKLLSEEAHPSGRLRLLFTQDGRFIATHDSYTEIDHQLKLCTYPIPVDTEGVPNKTFPYTARLEILDKAKSLGCDEAIVINSHNEVCEGAVSNLFFYANGEWITPPITRGVLPGVIRGLVIENLNVKVRRLDTNDLSHVQAAVATSSLKLAIAVQSIDGRVMQDLNISELFAEQIREMAIRTSVG